MKIISKSTTICQYFVLDFLHFVCKFLHIFHTFGLDIQDFKTAVHTFHRIFTTKNFRKKIAPEGAISVL